MKTAFYSDSEFSVPSLLLRCSRSLLTFLFMVIKHFNICIVWLALDASTGSSSLLKLFTRCWWSFISVKNRLIWFWYFNSSPFSSIRHFDMLDCPWHVEWNILWMRIDVIGEASISLEYQMKKLTTFVVLNWLNWWKIGKT